MDMKKTYITKLPDHVGAFLKANKCFADLGINIERVSYNKAIDTHTLFLDAEGTPEQLQKADEELKRLGYLQEKTGDSSIVLLEFKIGNGPGSAANILALVAEHDLNISYMNYQEFPDDYERDYQLFKVGLYVDGNDRMAKFLAAAEEIAVFKILEYDRTEKVYDNSIFYTSFVHGLSESLGLTQEKKDQLIESLFEEAKNRKKSKRKKRYGEKIKNIVVNRIENGESVYKVSKELCIPYLTIKNWVLVAQNEREPKIDIKIPDSNEVIISEEEKIELLSIMEENARNESPEDSMFRHIESQNEEISALKKQIADALGWEAFDTDAMLETLTKIGANVNVLTLYFKDGHTQTFEYIPPKQIHRKRKETP